MIKPLHSLTRNLLDRGTEPGTASTRAVRGIQIKISKAQHSEDIRTNEMVGTSRSVDFQRQEA
jgi:hypothetical protein